MINEQQFDEMKRVLKEAIQKVEYIPNTFQVFAWEAGLGKSKFSTQYVAEAFEERKHFSTFLIVKKFKSDVENTVEKLKSSPILKMYGENAVVGITSDNWGYWRENTNKLEKCMVLVITHQRYIELCEAELKAPFGNRTTLLIDEKVEFPIFEFSKSRYDHIRQFMSHKLQKQFDMINSPLLDVIEENELSGKNQIRVDSVSFEISLIMDFERVIEANRESIKGNGEILLNYLKELMFFYNHTVIFNGGKIFAKNPKHKLRTLQNNIILDASATIDSIYSGAKFVIVESRRVIDHSNSMFVVELRNSSRNAVKKQSEYMKDAVRFVKKLETFNKKCLYICHKSEAQNLKKEIENLELQTLNIHMPSKDTENFNTIDNSVAINWFGNIIGQNQYSDFNLCYIIGTNNLPYPVYLLQFAIYNEVEQLERWNLKIKKGKFVNDFVEDIRLGCVAADFYQAAKRIQRNYNPKGVFIIVNNDMEIAKKVVNQFRNIKDLAITRILEWDGSEKKQDTLDYKLNTHLKSLKKGKYRKSLIAEAIGTTTKNLGRLWKSNQVQYYEENGFLKLGHHDLEVLKEITQG